MGESYFKSFGIPNHGTSSYFIGEDEDVGGVLCT